MFSSPTNFKYEFHRAVEEGRIVPYSQPIISLSHGDVVGCEILARWFDTNGVLISPAVFIPMADRVGLLDGLLSAIMDRALAAAGNWPETMFVSFNISPNQLRNPALPKRLEAVAARHRFPMSRIRIEITETAVIADLESARRSMEVLSDVGCQISMDDFGTGYSSLTWLRSLPFSSIKIDATFIRSMEHERESRKIVSAVVGLGQSLGLEVVAEGVETEEQADLLRDFNCHSAQGYLFGRPVPVDSFGEVLALTDQQKRQKGLQKMTLEQRAYQISAIYRGADISIGFLDKSYIIVDASETFCRRFLSQIDLMVGKSIFECAKYDEDHLAWLRSFRESGLPYPPFQFVRPDGGIDVVTLTSVPDEAGDLLGYSVLGIEIQGPTGRTPHSW